MEIKVGDTLTVDGEIIGQSGIILFIPNEKVKVREVIKTEARWSNAFNTHIPEKITGVKLEGKYGIWFLNTFIETKHLYGK